MKKIISHNHANPYLPLWEHIPDGEPRVFEDPENPGKFRAYVIGSHDLRFDSYCGPDIRAWSAPVENLNDWRDEGAIFTYEIDGLWDVMYAPDLVEIKRKDGTKDYYLYPHSRGPHREAMVCIGPTPIGPFTPINLTEDGRSTVEGSVLGFDPAVFVEYITDPTDPDFEIGFRAYGYWGFQRSLACELDQTTMYSMRPGTEIHDYFIPASASYGNIHDPEGTTYPHLHPDTDLKGFNFFEAASIRKIGNKYIWIFSGYSGPDYGLSSTNSTLRYAYGDTLFGPWKAGGVLVDSRSVELNENGTALETYYAPHNTHGSIEFINDQWYCFYHRPPRGFGFARQAMVAPIQVQVDEKSVADGGKVVITGWDPATDGHVWTRKAGEFEYKGAEVTSEGFNIYGLNPYKYYSAGIACMLTNHGSQQDSWDIWDDHMSIITSPGDIIGYKYFAFGGLDTKTKGLNPFSGTTLTTNTNFNLWANSLQDSSFTIKVMLDEPWENDVWNGQLIAELMVDANKKEVQHLSANVAQFVEGLSGKHAIYLVVEGEAELLGLGFSNDMFEIERSMPPNIEIKVNGKAIELPKTPIRSTYENGITDYSQYEIQLAGYTELPEVVVTTDKEIDIYYVSPNDPIELTYRGVKKTYNLVFENVTRDDMVVSTIEGKETKKYTLKNDKLEFQFLNFGGAITKIALAEDNFEQNLVINYEDVTAYGNNSCYLNALVGRTSNRITDGMFTINGSSYSVELNDGSNNLHGGSDNLTNTYFDVRPIPNGYALHTTLKHQENGFPGDIIVLITYVLDDNKIKISYTGTSNKETVFNPTQHAYFNLSGNGKETINNHILQIDANRFAEINENSSFTKELNSVAGTRFDFTSPTKIDATDKPASKQYDLATGYDHLFVLNQNFDGRPAATFTHPDSGRQLNVYTSEPTMQFYAGNYIDDTMTFEGDVVGRMHLGACFETHKNPFDFQSQIIHPGVATTVQETVWEFTKGCAKSHNVAPKSESV